MCPRSDGGCGPGRQGTVCLAVSLLGYLLLLCGLFLAFFPTRAEVQAAPDPVPSQTVQCGIPLVVVYGHPFPGPTRQATEARGRCQAKAKPRLVVAEITVPVGAGLVIGAGLWRRMMIHRHINPAAVQPGRSR